MTVLLGTLWISIKQIKAPYVFDWENAIALHAMQGIGPHQVARGKSHGFLEFRQAPRLYSRVRTWMPILNGSLFSEVRTKV